MSVTAIGLVTLMSGLTAPPPKAEPVVHEVKVQTPQGARTYYYLPADAPPELRAAYKAREFAERDVVIVEQTQELKFDMVTTARRAEAYRRAALAQSLPGAGLLPRDPVPPPTPATNATAVMPTDAGLARELFLADALTRRGELSDTAVAAAVRLALAGRTANDREGDTLKRFEKALAVLQAARHADDPARVALDRLVDAERRSEELLRRYVEGGAKGDRPAASADVLRKPEEMRAALKSVREPAAPPVRPLTRFVGPATPPPPAPPSEVVPNRPADWPAPKYGGGAR